MNAMNRQNLNIGPETMIPDLLAAAPQTRPVLDKYGLRGCGGPMGPVETLDFFARAHGVPLEPLLNELRAAQAQHAPEASAASNVEAIADSIYRPFFKAGIVVALTLGAVWGAYLLLRIGILRSFTAVGIHEVNAHGHAQIFGWVGLFVMGFAYQAFPRFKHTSLAYPRLALSTLWMMALGILTHSGAQAFLGMSDRLASVAVAGAMLEITAITLFVWIIWRTLRGSGKPFEIYDYYIFSALAWFVLQAVYETIYFAALASAPDREHLLTLVSTWQAPLRDAQIHGFILLMILGVSHRIFHPFYGLAAPKPRRSVIALVAINAAVVGEITGFVLMRAAGHAWAALWYGAALTLAGAVVYLVSGWRLHARPRETDRSLKFMRTAYAWLFVSLAMMILLPLYQFALLPWLAPGSEAVEMGFSHAYYGAIRHAITVGFTSLMIVGVAAKVAPTLMGVDLRTLPALWIPYALINTGCAMRVGFQTLTDFSASAFPIAGVSGLLEVAGLAVWGAHLWRIMAGRYSVESVHAPATRLAPGAPIAAENRVGDVLDTYPELLPVFIKFGFTPLANPVLRKTLAKHITIEGAARRLEIDLATLLKTLNDSRANEGNSPQAQHARQITSAVTPTA